MRLKKNIKLGKIKFYLFFILQFLLLFISFNLSSANDLEGNFTSIKILDKISSKNILINLKNGEETKHKDLLIKSMKCKN